MKYEWVESVGQAANTKIELWRNPANHIISDKFVRHRRHLIIPLSTFVLIFVVLVNILKDFPVLLW